MKGNRIVNFRTFAFSAVACAAAVFSFVLFYINVVAALTLLLLGLVAIIAVAVVNRENKTIVVGCVIALAVLFISFASCITVAASYQNNTLISEDKVTDYNLCGTVEEVYDDGLNKRLLICPSEGSSYGNVIVYLSETEKNEIDLDKVNIGDTFSAIITLSKAKLIENGSVNGYFYRLNVRYTAYVGAGDFVVVPREKLKFSDYIRERIKDVFTSNLGKDNGRLAYGMVVGDKSQLNIQTKNAFSVAGIGHILAVSGLHVMFLSFVISFICKCLKSKRLVNFIVTAAVLLMYNILVGFTASVVRATIMSLCMQFASVSGERNDSLNNLGLACTIYLVIRPFSLYDAGFVLSVTAVLGIIFFNRPISSLFRKLFKGKINKVTDAIALSLSAQIGITPAMVFYFERLSVYSVFVNFVLAYVIMVTFIVLFVSMIIALVLPFAGVIVKTAYPGLWIMNAAAKLTKNIPGSNIIVYAGVFIFTLYIAYFFISRFFMCGKFKALTVGLCVMYCVGTVLCCNLPFTIKPDRMYCYPDKYGQTVSVVTFDKNKTALVADLTGKENISDRFKVLKIRKLDEIILLSANYSIAREIVVLSNKVDVGTVYVFSYGDAVELFDEYGIACRVIKDNEKTPLGFSFERRAGVRMVRLEYIESVLFAPSSFVPDKDNAEVLSSCTVLRAFKSGTISGKTVLDNKIFEGNAYYFDFRSGKREIFN